MCTCRACVFQLYCPHTRSVNIRNPIVSIQTSKERLSHGGECFTYMALHDGWLYNISVTYDQNQ